MRAEELIERLDRWLREDDDSGYYGGPVIPATKLNGEEIRALRSLLLSQKDRIEALEKERDDADRRAGAAEREMESLKDSAQKRSAWLDRAKEAAGYHRNTSFDRVWADALAALLAARATLDGVGDRAVPA